MGNDAKILTGIGVLTVIIVIVAAFTIGNKPSSSDQSVLGESQKKVLTRKDSFMVGNPKAKVTVVEFADFECPACGAADPITRQIKKDYKDKIAYYFREFPLNIHKNGYTSALAAESAGGQGKFWEMHDLLFDKQKDWSDKDNPLDLFSKYAKSLGLDVDKFKQDYNDKKYDSRIQQDLNDANQLGVDSTPTFYINGTVYRGVLSYDDFKSHIDAELK